MRDLCCHTGNAMKRIALPLATLLLLVTCSSPDTQVDTSVEVPVEVSELEPQSIEEYVHATGTAYAVMEVMLQSESAGDYRLADNPATGRPFALGDPVNKDQVIIHLDNPEQENAIRIESHKLALDNARREFEKQQSLYDKGGVTLGELNTAEKNYVDAKYAHENARIQLEKLKVRAPFSGVIVGLPYYTEGVRVPGGSDMVHLMDYTTLKMQVNLPGKLLEKVRPGQTVRVTNYENPDRKLTGEVTQVSPALDSETRTFKATIDVNNPELAFRPGMFVKAEIVTARKEGVIVIPKDIVMQRRGRSMVFIVEQGYADDRYIETGMENPNEMEVTEGLTLNDRVVTRGFETLVDNAKVRIAQEGRR